MTSSYVKQQIAWFEQIVRDKEQELVVEQQRHHRKSIMYQQLIAHKNDRIQFLEELDAKKALQLQSLERETASIKQRLRDIEHEETDDDDTDTTEVALTTSRFVPESRQPRQATFEHEVRPAARAPSSPPRIASREMRDSLGKLEFEKRVVSDELLRLRDELQSTRVEMEQQRAVLARIDEASVAKRAQLDDSDNDDGTSNNHQNNVADLDDSFCSSASSDIEMLVARIDDDGDSSIMQMLAVELNNKGGFFVTPRASRPGVLAADMPLSGDWLDDAVYGATTTPTTHPMAGGRYSPSRYTPLYLYSPPHNGNDDGSNEVDDEDDDGGCLEDSTGSCEWIWSDEVPTEAPAAPAIASSVVMMTAKTEIEDLQPLSRGQAQVHVPWQQPLELFDQVASHYHHNEFSNHFEEILLDNSNLHQHQHQQQFELTTAEFQQPQDQVLQFASPSPVLMHHYQYAREGDSDMKWIPTPTFERLQAATIMCTPPSVATTAATYSTTPFTFKQPSPIPDMSVVPIEPSEQETGLEEYEYALELDEHASPLDAPFIHQSSRVELAVCSRLLARLEQNNTELIMVQTHADIVEHQHEQLVLQLADNERLIQHYKQMAKEYERKLAVYEMAMEARKNQDDAELRRQIHELRLATEQKQRDLLELRKYMKQYKKDQKLQRKKQKKQQRQDAENRKNKHSSFLDTPTTTTTTAMNTEQRSGASTNGMMIIDKTLNSAQRVRRHLSFLGRSGTPLKETPFQPIMSLSLDPTADLPSSSSSSVSTASTAVKSSKRGTTTCTISSPASPKDQENDAAVFETVSLKATPVSPTSMDGSRGAASPAGSVMADTPNRRRAITASAILDRFRSVKKDPKSKRFVEY